MVPLARRPWLLILLLLAFSWLEGEMRRLTLERFGLHVALALAFGIGAVLLTKMPAGLARWTGLIVVLFVGAVIGIIWQYLHRPPLAPFGWSDAIGGAVSFLIVPAIIAAIYGNQQLGAGWTFIQVSSLAIVAAPVSTLVSFILATLITGE